VHSRIIAPIIENVSSKRSTSLHDPFDEHSSRRFRRRLEVLGGVFEFESDSRRLLRLLDTAYAGLPAHRFDGSAPHFHVDLQLTSGQRFPDGEEPPALRTQGGAGFLCGVVDGANFAVVSPAARRGLIALSRELLRFPYHARYELLEFSVFTLASRAQGLAPLHAGCVGSKGRGALLIGDSGAGKSTLALHCMLDGLDFLAEDAVFVAPKTLLATGIANYLHLRGDSLHFVSEASVAAQIRKSPVIRRRSGIEKYEMDLRRTSYPIARTPVTIANVVFLSKKPATGDRVLKPLVRRKLVARLAASQPYAAHLPSWRAFAKSLSRVTGFELGRPRHPGEGASALRRLLDS
jgi:hypothetical protein